ncbi:hypothetical protein OC846_003170 [Tilletia horrida]|uniref:DUF155 domain-containing protein n=1 Tax=Tilletia horrida TaxID=155126 RepID=A0AAN6JSA9_9BASI|nr:hypothetical protein OC846_003170 [Tilletia horrida]KAK0561630.1 hypothetical protein OC861_005713 [Tilletia horrida]
MASKLTGMLSASCGRRFASTSSHSSPVSSSSQALTRTRSKIPTSKTKAAQATRIALPSLPEVIAYSTAQAYDFASLTRSNRLPPGWSLLEEGNVIHIPSWPTSSSSASDTNTNTDSAGPLPGETFIFRSGAYVTWGITEDQARRFHRAVIRGRPNKTSESDSKTHLRQLQSATKDSPDAVEMGAYDQIGDEAMEYLIRQDQPTRIVGDLIVLGHKPRLSITSASSSSSSSSSSKLAVSDTSSADSTYAPWSPLLARLSFSLGLARSARLTTQENSLDMFMLNPSSSSGPHPTGNFPPITSSTISSASSASSYQLQSSHASHSTSARIPLSDIPRQLERTGKVPLGRKEVIKRMGKLLRLRLEANLDVEESFLDDNAFWENERLQNHYDSICRALDIDRRFKAFNEKLDHVESLLSTLRALLTESSTHRMEVIIILLIALEVLNAFFGHMHLSPSQTPTPVMSERFTEVEAEGEASVQEAAPSSSGFFIPSISGLWRWLIKSESTSRPAVASA